MFISCPVCFTRQFTKQGLTGLHQGRREVLTLSQKRETKKIWREYLPNVSVILMKTERPNSLLGIGIPH